MKTRNALKIQKYPRVMHDWIHVDQLDGTGLDW